jgi:DNA-binding beta-propeller fold protein YncE
MKSIVAEIFHVIINSMKKIFNIISFVFLFVFSFIFSTQSVFAFSIVDWAITGGTGSRYIAIDSTGNVYTSNMDSLDVTKITPEGVNSILASTGVGTNPRGIAVDSAGNVYTANSTSNNISKITPGGIASIFATVGTSPYDLAIDSDDNIYVMNQDSENVTKVTSLGATSVLGTTGSIPQGITVNNTDGTVYVANGWTNNVSKITSLGVSSILATVDTNPEDIAIDSAGNLYTANGDVNNVSKVTPAGVSAVLGTTGTYPRSIAVDSHGNVFVANSSSNNVTKITPAGVSTIVGTTGAYPRSIALDSDGNIYTVNYTDNTVTKITNPTITETTPVTTPTSDGDNLQYTFTSNSAGTIAYGGSCTSDTTSTIVGETTVTFHSLGEGTYDDCTITVTDEFGPSNVLPIPTFTVDKTDPIISVVSVGGDSNPSYATTENMPSIVFTTEVGDTVAIPDWTCSPTPATGTTVTCVPDAELSFGIHTVNITMEDAALNSTTDSLTFVVKKRTASVGGYLKPVNSSITSGITKFTFTKNLKFLTLDNEVKELQKFLNTHGYPVSLSGAGSSGLETTKFGLLTQKALIKFQKANNITPAVGYFGPITRAKVNSLN